MFNKNVFTQKDPIADIIKGINEADYKAKMEELKGNQHKIDKNKNNKIDAHDFKILRGEKKTMKEEEEVEESNNPFDVKNYKSQLKTKPGEKAGFDSKKVSTGTIYSRKPVKDEPMKKEEIDPNDTTTDTLKGREKTSANPFLSKKVKMDVPDNVKEDVEQIDELSKDTLKSYSAKAKKDSEEYKKAGYAYDSDPDERAFAPKAFKKAASRAAGAAKADSKIKEDIEQVDEANTETKQEFLARQQRLAAAHSETQKDPKRLARLMKIPGYSDAMKLAQKTTQKEEVEDLDERTLSKGETAEKERIVKGMKKSLKGFKARYGDKAKSVMYATATKAAKKD